MLMRNLATTSQMFSLASSSLNLSVELVRPCLHTYNLCLRFCSIIYYIMILLDLWKRNIFQFISVSPSLTVLANESNHFIYEGPIVFFSDSWRVGGFKTNKQELNNNKSK